VVTAEGCWDVAWPDEEPEEVVEPELESFPEDESPLVVDELAPELGCFGLAAVVVVVLAADVVSAGSRPAASCT
jgi:hypothetical protein